MTAAAIAAALLLTQPAQGDTLTYGDALQEALARNSDLGAARARLDQARTIGWKAWASQLPQVAAAATWTRNDRSAEIPAFPPLLPGPVVLQPLLARGAQVQVTLPLLAPQLWFGIAAAGAGQRQAEWTAETARREILFGAAQLYHGAVGSMYAVRITERQLAIAREHEQDARVRQAAGTTPRAALLRAEIDRARAEQDLRTARAAYDAARVGLAAILDRERADFEVESPPGDPGAPDPNAGDERSALRDRPEVQAAAAALEAAERARGALRASYLPAVAAFARGQWQDPAGPTGERRTWAAGLALTWNLFDGTLREAQLRESGARVAEALSVQRSAETRVREEVARARLELDAALANREKAREQVALARENQRLVEVSYRAGAATYLEVSDALAQLAGAELAAVAEQVKSSLAALRLLRAAGRFSPG